MFAHIPQSALTRIATAILFTASAFAALAIGDANKRAGTHMNDFAASQTTTLSSKLIIADNVNGNLILDQIAGGKK